MIRALLASTAGILAAGTAAAGGYVAAIPQVAPTVGLAKRRAVDDRRRSSRGHHRASRPGQRRQQLLVHAH